MDGFTNHDLRAEMDRLHRCMAADSRALLERIATFDQHDLWRVDGARDMAEWVSARFDISRWRALRWVKAARRLAELPLISEALGSGALCLDKVVELTRFATPETEGKLIGWARRVMVSTVRAEADAKAPKDRDSAESVERARTLGWWWDTGRDAMVLSGRLPAADGEIVAAVLDHIASQLPLHPDAEPLSDEHTIDERRADALVSLALEAAGGRREATEEGTPEVGGATETVPERGTQEAPSTFRSLGAPTIVVHAELDALLNQDEGGLIESGSALHPETVARLCCDARLQAAIESDDGQPIGVGHERYLAPRWLRRQIEYRDRWTCTFHGCEMKRFLQTHHTVPWPKGPTDINNLVLVCTFHHKLVHEYGWRVELVPTGGTRWFRSDGSLFRAGDHAGLPGTRAGPRAA
jgi:hypothetical protein